MKPTNQAYGDIPQIPEEESDLDGVIKKVLMKDYPDTAEAVKKRNVNDVFVEIVKKAYFFLLQKRKNHK